MSIERARRVRASRTAALKRLSQRQLALADALKTPPKALRSVDLYVVLMACPSINRESCRTICERAGVWPHLTLSELTPSQREALVSNLPARVG